MLIINYRNSFIYVQKMINRILRLFHYFCKKYINNIIIFFISLEKHFNHFN